MDRGKHLKVSPQTLVKPFARFVWQTWNLLVLNLHQGNFFPPFFCPFENHAFVVCFFFCRREQTPTSFKVLHLCSDISLVGDSIAALHLPLSVVHTLIPLSVNTAKKMVGGRQNLSARLIPPSSVSHISYCCQRCYLEWKALVKPTEELIWWWRYSYPCRGFCMGSLPSKGVERILHSISILKIKSMTSILKWQLDYAFYIGRMFLTFTTEG